MRTKTKGQYIKEVEKVHGTKYDYSLLNYVNKRTKVEILCKNHGSFWKRPDAHRNGQGCPVCSNMRLSKIKSSSTKDFIKKSIDVHGDKYDYSLVDYVNNVKKVSIICQIHGEFKQSPCDHIRGHDCKKCSYIKNNKGAGWEDGRWGRCGKNSKNFSGFKVYILKCWDEEEEFYKVGKTFNTIKERFPKKNSMPYNFKILRIIEGDSIYISKLEKHLHNLLKDFKYKPIKNFGGKTECYNKLDYGLKKIYSI